MSISNNEIKQLIGKYKQENCPICFDSFKCKIFKDEDENILKTIS